MNKGLEQGADARSVHPSRQRLREIARLWISSLRAFYAGDAENPLSLSEPVMGNLQSDGKKKHRKSKDSATILEDSSISTEKINKSFEHLDCTSSNVKISFEKVHTPAKRPAPKPPKVTPKVGLFRSKITFFFIN